MLFHYISIFFFNDTATTEIYTLSLHDALPILRMARVCSEVWATSGRSPCSASSSPARRASASPTGEMSASHQVARDRKSTRLNSSHANISYAVFFLKKKKNNESVYTSVYLSSK